MPSKKKRCIFKINKVSSEGIEFDEAFELTDIDCNILALSLPFLEEDDLFQFIQQNIPNLPYDEAYFLTDDEFLESHSSEAL